MIIRVGRPAYQPLVMLRRAGYTEFRDPRTGETSYIRRLGTNFYPRFHLYTQDEGTWLRLNLHLDQKQPSYGSYTKHSGEYDGPLVEAEAERIHGFFRS
ncbi:MAG: hypothetical protein HY975_04640 [Candidatus Kerfeldbacteria bacterium]|nr:hypothetical protein [Candidatus Kerfeldbacteria bacterium]